MADQSTAKPQAESFRYWQNRILILTLAGYALFYLVRKNIGVAAPAMYEYLGITKSQFGLFLTLHGLLYGLSKFFNGIVADRVSAVVHATWFGFVRRRQSMVRIEHVAHRARRYVVAQRLVSRDGISALCAAYDPLVFAA